MASAQEVMQLFARQKIEMISHIPGDTAANDVGWKSMVGYEGFAAIVMATNLTGNGVTAFSLLVNTAAAGGGTDGTLKEHAVGSAPDATGDYLVLECTAAEIAQLGSTDGRSYVGISASVTAHNGSDEFAVTYIRWKPTFAYDDLTADYVS